MTPDQYLLNLALLTFVLVANLGTRPITWARLLAPLGVAAAVGWVFLRNAPTIGNDTSFMAAGAALGVAFGVAAGLLVSVRRGSTGLLVSAGPAYAAVWILVIGGRMLFAYGAQHWFGAAVGRFSTSHQITGSAAWTAAFVVMAVAMIAARAVVTGARAAVTLGTSHTGPTTV